jgi:hypothetical protein
MISGLSGIPGPRRVRRNEVVVAEPSRRSDDQMLVLQLIEVLVYLFSQPGEDCYSLRDRPRVVGRMSANRNQKGACLIQHGIFCCVEGAKGCHPARYNNN